MNMYYFKNSLNDMFRKKWKKIAFSEKVNSQGIGEIDNSLLIPIIQSL